MQTLRHNQKFINDIMTRKPSSDVGLPEGLYRRWSFNTLSDEVASIPLTLYGNATLADGSLVINGNNQSQTNYAQLSGNNFPTEYDGGITIEFWQNTTDRRNWARVFDFGFDTSNYTFFSTTMGSNNYARTAVKCGSSEAYVDSTYMTPGETWHTAVVYDLTSQTGKTLLSVCSFSPSGTMTKSTVTMNQDMAHAMSAWNINYLGRSFYADKDFDGSIQEFRIWNKTLTEEELAQNDTLGPDKLKPDAEVVQPHIVSCFYNAMLVWGGGEEKPDPLSALYRHWTFDTLYDEVAGVPVTLFGNAHLDNGSLVINGSGSAHVNYAQLSGNNWPTASYDGGVTVEFWTEPYAHVVWTHLLDFGEQTDKHQVAYLKAGDADCMYLEMQGSTYSTSGRVAAPTLNLNTLQHVAIAMDLTSNAPDTAVSVYQFQPDHSMTLNTGVLPINLTSFWQGSDKQFLGRTGNPSWQDADYSGRYADFRIWSTTLSEEQLRALDNAGPDALPQ